ncbi:MAG: TRAP transporter substrate-binding protein DctP [Desulfobacterales bacterium]|nr:TRAP transporter substrate-binding protein DctP [Desulfobacterales bacterium]
MTTAKAIDIEKDVQESVGNKVRALRKAMNLNLTQLSEKTGISQGHLSKIETGKTTISVKTLSQICQFFNRPLNYLFHREEATHIIGTLNVGEGPEKDSVIWFGKDVQKTTRDQISLVRLEADQMGTATNPVEFLRKGIIHLFMDDLLYFRAYVPDYDIFALPYLFKSLDHQVRFLKSGFFDEKLKAPLLENGIRLINPRWNWFRGVERILVSRKPVFSPEDVKGLRVRIFNSDTLKAYWEHLGAEPVFIPFEKVGEALRTGEIDIMPSYKAHAYPMGFCKNARYVTEMGDISTVVCVAMNEEKYQLLPPDAQAGLISSCERAGDKFSNLVLERSKTYRDLDIKENNAVYIKTDLRPWQAPLESLKKNMVKSGDLSEEICRKIDSINLQESMPA